MGAKGIGVIKGGSVNWQQRWNCVGLDSRGVNNFRMGCSVNGLRGDIGVDYRGESGADGLRGGVLVSGGDMVLMVFVFSGGYWC